MFFAAGMYGAGLPVYYFGFGAAGALAGGMLAGVALAALFGLLALRTSGVSFLIVSLMVAQALYLTTLYFNEVTLGDQGFIISDRLAPLTIGGLSVGFHEPALKYNFALAVFALALALCLALRLSPIGRVLIAIRENEERTRLLGYDSFRYRLLSLVVSGGLAALAGAAYALIFSYVGSTFASILFSIYPLLWTLLGGVGTLLGPLLGAGLMFYLVDFASSLTSAYLLLVGVALVVLILWFPQGILGTVRAKWLPWLP
jgi:branched-chain amino acid transport system permease protein